ncbi:MAG: protease HtpX [Enterobacterales bacterium]
MLRTILLLFTNLSVMSVLGVFLHLFGIKYNNLIILIIFSCICGFIGAFVSLFFAQSIALKSVNGKIIKKPTDEKEIWLMDIIKKQSNKLNINTPKFTVYESDDINAFATGAHKNSALIAVSKGLLKKMDNNSIEAVLAHEISHIYNGDMVTMILLQGVINTFTIFISKFLTKMIVSFLTNLSKKQYLSSSILDKHTLKNNFDSKQYSLLFNIISLVLEAIFGLLSNLIICWFSRYREFYADAGSAKLVGRSNMISALKFLQGSDKPKVINKSMKTLFINNFDKHNFSKLLSSHPSCDERIEALILKRYE